MSTLEIHRKKPKISNLCLNVPDANKETLPSQIESINPSPSTFGSKKIIFSVENPGEPTDPECEWHTREKIYKWHGNGQKEIYGWYQIYPEFVDIPDFPGYSMNHRLEIKGKRVKIMKINQFNMVNMYKEKKGVKMLISRLALHTFFPHIEGMSSEFHCDHIDGNYQNNNLTNLQWLPSAENIRKGGAAVRKSHGSTISKVVYLLDKKGGKRIEEFASVTKAAEKLGISNRSICASAQRGYAIKGNYLDMKEWHEYEEPPEKWGVWRTSKNLAVLLQQEDLPDEHYNRVWASSHGYIRTKFMRPTKGSQNRNSVYRRIERNRKKRYVHHLIFAAFDESDDIFKVLNPKEGQEMRYVVCHADEVEKDDDGCYRNHFCDLSVRSQSSNMIECYSVKRKRSSGI